MRLPQWRYRMHGVIAVLIKAMISSCHAMCAADRAFLLRQGVRIADGEVRTVLNRAQLEALYGAKLAVFRDRESGESAFLPG